MATDFDSDSIDLDRSDYSLWIDGSPRDASTGETTGVRDPSIASEFARVSQATEDDVAEAVDASRAAFDGWQALSAQERGRRLGRVVDVLRVNKEKIAALETRETGKPRSEAVSEVESCISYFEYYSEYADKFHGETIPVAEEYVDYTLRVPLGVTVHVVPWNFPLSLFARSVAPALAGGNVVIAKPAGATPLTAVVLGELATAAGLPDGVLNIVPGRGSVAGAALVRHRDVDAVGFTGSVSTGRTIARQAADAVTPVHLELGGKSPNVVFPDADLENAVEETVTAIFRNAGQVCSSGSRLLLHEDIHDEFVERLVPVVEDLTVGPGDADPDVGPVITEDQYETVLKYLDLGRKEVGPPVVGGEALDRDGWFIEPTVFDDVDNEMRIAQEEIFGPVLVAIEFADETEAIEIANDTQYGLVAGVFTEDLGRAHRFAREVRAGQIYINKWFAGGRGAPFGGFKDSGYGRVRGKEGMKAFTTVKNVCAKIDD